MKKTPVLLLALRRLMFGAGIAIVIAIAMTDRADAQAVAIVNGDPITAFDVEQRAKLIQLSTHQTKSRNEVVEEKGVARILEFIAKEFTPDPQQRTDVLPPLATVHHLHPSAQVAPKIEAAAGLQISHPRPLPWRAISSANEVMAKGINALWTSTSTPSQRCSISPTMPATSPGTVTSA